MFDRFFTNVKPPERVQIDVTMPRPDAAESMRLANEMRREAERDVANAVVKRYGCNNYVYVVECSTERVFENKSYRARVKFKLNDELYDTDLFDLETNEVTSRDVLEEAILEQIMRQIKTTLTRKL